MAQAGDDVLFHFHVTGENTLRSKSAVVIEVSPDTEIAVLEVDFTPDEISAWSYARVQSSSKRAVGRRPVSGEWTVPHVN